MKIVVATGNRNKLREMKELLYGTDFELTTMGDEGMNDDIVEDGSTFTENALIKAHALRKFLLEKYKNDLSKMPMVMADDSGLCIDALGGEPGIYSARYLGEDKTYEERFNYIFDKLKGLSGQERSAHFHCVIALIYPDGREVIKEGVLDAEISTSVAGTNGFGYDPILYVPSLGKTTAEISAEEKNEISHRGKAIRAICEHLINEF